MRCNIIATSFVKKTLKKAHGTLVERLVEKAHIRETELHNHRLEEQHSNSIMSYYSDPRTPGMETPLHSPNPSQPTHNVNAYPNAMQGHPSLDHRGSLRKPPYSYSPPMGGMQQAFVDPRYSQSTLDSRYSQPPPDPRYSQPSTQGQDDGMMHQTYNPVELPSSTASSKPQMAELDSLSAQSRRF